jgi:hypothetical protein
MLAKDDRTGSLKSPVPQPPFFVHHTFCVGRITRDLIRTFIIFVQTLSVRNWEALIQVRLKGLHIGCISYEVRVRTGVP